MGTNEDARFVYGKDELAWLWKVSRDAREAPRQRRKVQLDISDYGEATEIGTLLGRRIRPRARIYVDLARLDEILRAHRFGMGLDEVLELVHERPLMRRRTVYQERAERRQQQMQLLFDALDVHGLCGQKWVHEWVDVVLQRPQDNLVDLAPEVSRILAALNLNPDIDPSEWRDGRALGIPGNRSTVTRMVLRAAAIAHGLNYPESSEGRRLLWERCGVREHSRSVSIAGKPQSFERGRDERWRDGWYSGQEAESPNGGSGDFALASDGRVEAEASGYPGHEADIFISHASEDKSVIVRRLAEELREAGVEVWYDDFSLSAGDSLRESIDQGIAASALGLVVLSHNFFRKNWARQELGALFSASAVGRGRLIPVWLDVTAEDLHGYSPLLSDKKALRAEDGFEKLIHDICIAVRDVKFRNLNRDITIAPIRWSRNSCDAVCLFGRGRTLVEGGKLPDEVVIGRMARSFAGGGAVVPDNLIVNTSFVHFLHGFIAHECPADEQAIEEANVIGTGRLLVIDGRRGSSGDCVNSEQVIGSFHVDRGKIVQGSYKANPDHSILTKYGMFRLPKALEGKLSGVVNRTIARVNAFRGFG